MGGRISGSMSSLGATRAWSQVGRDDSVEAIRPVSETLSPKAADPDERNDRGQRLVALRRKLDAEARELHEGMAVVNGTGKTLEALQEMLRGVREVIDRSAREGHDLPSLEPLVQQVTSLVREHGSEVCAGATELLDEVARASFCSRGLPMPARSPASSTPAPPRESAGEGPFARALDRAMDVLDRQRGEVRHHAEVLQAAWQLRGGDMRELMAGERVRAALGESEEREVERLAKSTRAHLLADPGRAQRAQMDRLRRHPDALAH